MALSYLAFFMVVARYECVCLQSFSRKKMARQATRTAYRCPTEETYKNDFGIDSDMYKQKRLLTEIIEAIKTTSDDTTIYEIFADIIHMHINRLCGINKEKEIEIVNYCYLLIKSLEAYHKYN